MNKNNEKAQISLDFILAILFAIIFFMTLTVLSNNIISMQNELAIRAQLKEIAQNTAQTISQAQILNEENSNFELSYLAPMVTEPGNSMLQRCTIQISTATSTVTATLEGASISETSVFSAPNGITINTATPFECGKKIKISKAGVFQ